MQQKLTSKRRVILIVMLTIISVACALFLGKWGRTLSVVLIGFALATLTSGCLRFFKARGLQQGSSMLFSLVLAAGYVFVILGSYGYFRG